MFNVDDFDIVMDRQDVGNALAEVTYTHLGVACSLSPSKATEQKALPFFWFDLQDSWAAFDAEVYFRPELT